MTEAEKRKAINAKITEVWDKLVADSRQICSFNSDKWADDLLQHILVDFLEKKDIDYQYQVAITNNKLPNYIGYAMSMAVRSGSSTFYNTHRRFLYNTRGVYEANDNTNEDLWDNKELMVSNKDKSPEDCVVWALEQLDFYDKTLVQKKFYEKWTWDEINDYYGIPLNSGQRDLKKALNKIKELCSHFDK